MAMMKLTSVKVLDEFCLKLDFADGVEGIVNLSYLAGNGVFAPWLEPGEFGKVEIGEAGELRWPCGVDLCPDSLYLKITGKTPEELFGVPQPLVVHA